MNGHPIPIIDYSDGQCFSSIAECAENTSIPEWEIRRYLRGERPKSCEGHDFRRSSSESWKSRRGRPKVKEKTQEDIMLDSGWCDIPIRCVDTGRKYYSAWEAKEKTGINLRILKSDLLGEGRHWKFMYVRR